MRMGFSSVEVQDLVDRMAARGLLCHGAGRLILEFARSKGLSVREAGLTLLEGHGWEDLQR